MSAPDDNPPAAVPEELVLPEELLLPQEFDLFALRTFKYCVEPQSEKVGKLIGYWSDGSSRVFRPVVYDKADGWEDGTCEATCGNSAAKMVTWGGDVLSKTNQRHQPPDERCGCGIYAALSYADVLHQYRQHARHIVAVVAAEGVTIIGTRGLRTQFARVVAYWVDPGRPPRSMQRRRLWAPGRPVVVSREGVVGDELVDMEEPTYREVAALQFKDAQPFDDPQQMIEEYGLPLLPPAHASQSGGFWTGGTPGRRVVGPATPGG